MSALARSTDPTTSFQAAAMVDVTSLETDVLEILFASPWGMTTPEIAAALKRELVSISPRMRPLVNKGAVIDSGYKTRGPSGRFQIVWKAVL